MRKRKDGQPDAGDQRKASQDRPHEEPDTLEGPGGRHETSGEDDARNKTTRRGER